MWNLKPDGNMKILKAFIAYPFRFKFDWNAKIVENKRVEIDPTLDIGIFWILLFILLLLV